MSDKNIHGYTCMVIFKKRIVFLGGYGTLEESWVADFQTFKGIEDATKFYDENLRGNEDIRHARVIDAQTVVGVEKDEGE